jgi:hypothetical protein
MTRSLRAQSAITAAIASALLAADLLYVALRWTGTSSHFGRGFETGLVAIALTIPLTGLARLPLPGLSPRDRQRFASAVSLAGFAAVMWLTSRLADTEAGILGLLAGLAIVFIALSAWWFVRPPRVASRRLSGAVAPGTRSHPGEPRLDDQQ